ncbi:MAG: class I SAM-dependent RNA methyltransferase [Planctomycetes bacterium]|nr:class I SAM-dependent RNA methyltransferase [Planctomycetota bacterium]
MPTPPDTPLYCPHFGPCGGCTLLDTPIESQLAQKQAHARSLLSPWLSDLVPEISLPPRTPRHDRLSLLFPAARRGHELVLGIYRRGSHDILPITDCRIQAKALTRLATAAAKVMNELSLDAYHETTQRGLVRAFRARVMPGTGELLLGVVTTRADFSERIVLGARLADIAHGLKDEQGKALPLVGVVVNHNPRPGNVLLGPDTAAIRGQTFQTDRQDGLEIRVSFASFYQQHRHSSAILFRPALQLLGDVAGQRVVDGYGGVGSFGLRLLRAGAAHVTLIESSPSAGADARHNFAANGLAAAAEVHQAPFGEAPLPPCDLLIVDPPRAGLMERGAAAVLAASPPRVLLVSCALEGLARDLTMLSARYRVAAVRLCDLFPHTEHVEAVTLLERR